MKKQVSKHKTQLVKRLRVYYITSIFSIFFALIGFSYNLWRLEVSEKNNTIRIAAFSMLTELAELEQIVYAAHYDKDTIVGNPRNGWVKVGLIVELSNLISEPVTAESLILKKIWGRNWSSIPNAEGAANEMVDQIDNVRGNIRKTLTELR